MEESSVNERLWAIAERFSVPKPVGLMGTGAPPFDISRPNSHDSKAEFLQEKRTVSSALANAKPLLDLLTDGVTSEGSLQGDVVMRTLQVVDSSVRSKRRTDRLVNIFDLARSNAAAIGVSAVLMFLLFDFVESLKSREKELESQEEAFWSGNGRAPNHFARTIALRFAKLVARVTGRKPTFGTARDGGHPSTDFGRALEEIFKILDVGADVRNAAKWAIGQLSDDDLRPLPVNTLAGPLFGDTQGLHWKKTEDALLQAMMQKGS
jgi:hypothetical protein